jgi:hypothetical protein
MQAARMMRAIRVKIGSTFMNAKAQTNIANTEIVPRRKKSGPNGVGIRNKSQITIPKTHTVNAQNEVCRNAFISCRYDSRLHGGLQPNLDTIPLAHAAEPAHAQSIMGAYPGRKQVRKRAKRAAKNDRIIAKKAAAKK